MFGMQGDNFKFQKADKKALETKVNHKLFDKTTEEINNMIKEILDKLTGHVSVLNDLSGYSDQFTVRQITLPAGKEKKKQTVKKYFVKLKINDMNV